MSLGDGIAVFESAGNRIINNDVIRNGTYDGIAVLGLGADNNLIQGNLIADNVRGRFGGGGGGVVISNYLDGPNTRIPVRGNSVLDNEIRGNASSGVSNIANYDGVIARNRLVRNGLAHIFAFIDAPGHGIGLQGGPGLEDRSMRMVVEDNVVNDNVIAGIIVLGRTDHNLIRGNEVLRNGYIGIGLYPADNNTPPEEGPGHNSILNNDTGYNGIVDLNDFTGNGENCGTNEWFGNTWGPIMPLAGEFGLTTPYLPDCTATGGSLHRH